MKNFVNSPFGLTSLNLGLLVVLVIIVIVFESILKFNFSAAGTVCTVVAAILTGTLSVKISRIFPNKSVLFQASLVSSFFQIMAAFVYLKYGVPEFQSLIEATIDYKLWVNLALIILALFQVGLTYLMLCFGVKIGLKQINRSSSDETIA